MTSQSQKQEIIVWIDQQVERLARENQATDLFIDALTDGSTPLKTQLNVAENLVTENLAVPSQQFATPLKSNDAQSPLAVPYPGEHHTSPTAVLHHSEPSPPAVNGNSYPASDLLAAITSDRDYVAIPYERTPTKSLVPAAIGGFSPA